MVKNPTGRPSKYLPTYCNKIIEFFNYDPTTDRPKFFTDFCKSIDVDRDTLAQWTKVHPDFSVAFKKAKAIMINNIVVGGLVGNYNSGVTCFTLKNIAGWRDMPIEEKDENLQERELEFSGASDPQIEQSRLARFYN
jgi:hypothetical protein